MAFDKKAYDAEFQKRTYDTILLIVPKGKKEDIKNCAENHGVSMTRLIVNALETTYGLDLSK